MPFNSTNDSISSVEDYENKDLIGVVSANTDPLGISRVQAAIPDLYDPTQGPVPQIGAKNYSPFGFGTSATGPYGWYGSPQVGSKLRVELQHGDEHYPVYSPLYTVQDANPLFKAPTTWGFQDPSGNKLVVDMAGGNWTFTHSSGDQIAYDATGDRTTLINGNENLNVQKAMTVIVQGNCQIYSNTRVDIQAPLTTLNSIPPAP